MESNKAHMAVADVLRQSDERRTSQTNGDGAWTIVWDSWHESGVHHGGRFAAFAIPEYRDRAMQNAAWDIRKGDGHPGFSQQYKDGKPVITYHRSSVEPEFQPIIIMQEMYDVAEDAYLVSEEFRLLLNLWEDKADGSFYSFSDDGSKELAIEFSGSRIRIRTPLLRRYQAARQLDLLLFSDTRIIVSTEDPPSAFAALNEKDHIEGDSVVFLGVGEIGLRENEVFSRLLVKRVLPPPPQEKCGFWPWEDSVEEFPEFIIGEDEDGGFVRFTCNPDKLANYFGANPDSPHYLTPVFFRSDVLKRYYGDPSLYSVTDGRLECGSLWGVQIDNGSPKTVMVFLGDIGRDIPSKHRDHWRSYNIPPTGGMSESTFRRSFLNQFAETENPEHIFKKAYVSLQDSWLENWGWRLYREAKGADGELLQRLHIPLDNTDTEFEAQLLNLAKLLVDLLNEPALVEGLPPVKAEKGISKFERFLRSVCYKYVDRDIELLRRIQGLRSRIAAHTAGSAGQALLAAELNGSDRQTFFVQVLRSAIQMLEDLSQVQPQQNGV